MGSSQTVQAVKQLDEITECSICLSPFTDPRSLPCIHTYCSSCVCKYGNSCKPGDKMNCPICRAQFIVPESGLSGLPKNIFIETLLQIKQMSVSPSPAVPCEVCTVREQVNVATSAVAAKYCVECEEKLCDGCAKFHSNSKMSKSHQLIAFGDVAKLETDRVYRESAPPARCGKHTEQPLSVFCNDCKAAVCLTCCVTSHGQHDNCDIDEAAERFRLQLVADAKELTVGIGHLREMLESIEEQKRKFAKLVEEAEAAIHKRTVVIKSLLESQEKSLVDELCAKNSELAKQSGSVEDEITQHVSFMENLVKYAEELSKKGSSGEIARQTSVLHDRVCNLLKLDDIVKLRRAIDLAGVVFVPGKSSSTEILIGELFFKTITGDQSAPRPT